MTDQPRKKFTTWLNPETLSVLRNLAQTERCQLEMLVEESLTDLIEKRQHQQPRRRIIAAYHASHEKFGPLYQKLAEAVSFQSHGHPAARSKNS